MKRTRYVATVIHKPGSASGPDVVRRVYEDVDGKHYVKFDNKLICVEDTPLKDHMYIG